MPPLPATAPITIGRHLVVPARHHPSRRHCPRRTHHPASAAHGFPRVLAFILAAQVLPHHPRACSASETDLLLRTRAVSPSTQKTAASSGWIPDPTPQYRHCSTTTTTRTSPLRAQAEPPTNSKTANAETRLRRRSAQSPTRGYAKGALPRSGRHRHWPRGHGDRRTVEPIEGRTRTKISNASRRHLGQKASSTTARA